MACQQPAAERPHERLHHLQTAIERIYQLESQLDVRDFLVTDPAQVSGLPRHRNGQRTDETLFCRAEDDGIAVSLFINAGVLDRLDDNDPLHSLHDGNFADYCTALEGVSHFVYLTWNARFGRDVSLLELELQAEIDKFVSSAFLLGRQGDGRVPKELLGWLFESPRFDPDLDEQDRARYERANHFAERYCKRLEDRYLKRKRASGDHLVKELRRFYRLTQRQKLDRISTRQ